MKIGRDPPGSTCPPKGAVSIAFSLLRPWVMAQYVQRIPFAGFKPIRTSVNGHLVRAVTCCNAVSKESPEQYMQYIISSIKQSLQ